MVARLRAFAASHEIRPGPFSREVTMREGHLLHEILERKLQEKSLLPRAQSQ